VLSRYFDIALHINLPVNAFLEIFHVVTLNLEAEVHEFISIIQKIQFYLKENKTHIHYNDKCCLR
jgi:hypothetical protein